MGNVCVFRLLFDNTESGRNNGPNFNQRQQPQWSQPDSGPAREDGAHRADGLLKPSDESGQPQTGSAGADAATPSPESSPSSSRVVQLAGLSFGQVPLCILYFFPSHPHQ